MKLKWSMITALVDTEEDFGQRLNRMELFQESIVQAGQVILPVIMQQQAHFNSKIVLDGSIMILRLVILVVILISCVSSITEAYTN